MGKEEVVMDDTIANAAESFAQTAEFYQNYAKRFTPGTLGYVGNMAEAAKYADMASRFAGLALTTKKDSQC
jgi:uncharacterized protein Yka (UPF0111/DUF47 family)